MHQRILSKKQKKKLKECTEGYHDRKKVNKVGTK